MTENDEQQKQADTDRARYLADLKVKAEAGDRAAIFQLRDASIIERAMQIYDEEGNPRVKPA